MPRRAALRGKSARRSHSLVDSLFGLFGKFAAIISEEEVQRDESNVWTRGWTAEWKEGSGGERGFGVQNGKRGVEERGS